MDYRAYARQVAAQRGLDPGIFERQIDQESGFNPNAESPAGARGIAQFMPGTASWVAGELGISEAQFWSDPRQQIDGAGWLLRWLLDRYDGDYAKALAGYNAGTGAVDEYGGVPPYPETGRYVAAILGEAVNHSAHRDVLAEAWGWVGVPYVWGGQSRAGVDCSGYVLEVYRAAGYPITDDTTAEGLRSFGETRPWGQVHDGDVLFFDLEGAGEATHCGIRTGYRRMLHAPEPGDHVREIVLDDWWCDDARLLEARCYLAGR